MAILQSCCCWRSLRKGCYASALYTTVYFGVTVGIMSSFLHEERLYLSGNSTIPKSSSILEPDSISPTTMVFNIVLLLCASLGILASLILIFGLLTDNRLLLLPWIMTVMMTTVIDLAHSFYLFFLETMKFNPMTAILFTLDFFVLSLNIYCLLCVVSQYQEYKAGRGTLGFENLSRTVVRYTAQPTGTSCLSTRRPPTCNESKGTPAHSPSRSHRKQVQFDGLHAHWHNEGTDGSARQGNSPSEGGSSGEWLAKVTVGGVVDTEPLIAGVTSQAKDYKTSSLLSI